MHRTIMYSAAAFALVVPLAMFNIACGGDTTPEIDPEQDKGPYNLALQGSGFVEHNGSAIVAALKTRLGTELIGGELATTVTDGMFRFDWIDSLQKDQDYEAVLYADFNNSGACESPPVDHAWRVSIRPVSGNVEIDFDHDTLEHEEDFYDVCPFFGGESAPFDLTLTGTGYVPHEGQTLSATLVRTGDQTVVAGPDSATVSGGNFSVSWTGVLDPFELYELRYYMDHDGSGSCNAPPLDHGWVTPINDIQGGTTVAVTHNTDFSDVCETFGYFDVTVVGTQFADDDGEMVYVAVVDSGSGSVVAGPEALTVAEGGFTFGWPDTLIAGNEYEVHYFVDHNANGTCESPDDHSYVQPVSNLSGDADVYLVHNDNMTDICATFN